MEKAKLLFRLDNRRLALLLAGLLAVGYLVLAPKPEMPVFEHIVAVTAPGQNPPLYYIRPRGKTVALTFDISWGNKTLGPVLQILRENGTRATFFLSGPWSEHHPDLVKAIVADGHEIASHGQEHVNLSQYDGAAVAKNISDAHAILERVSGQKPRFFRPPNGDFDDLVVGTAREVGYETVIWSVDSLDWKNPGADYMIRRVTELAFPGAIILFHASDSSRQVHLALPPVIENLKEQGYRPVTLGELYDRGEPARRDPRGDPDYPPVTEKDILPEEPPPQPEAAPAPAPQKPKPRWRLR